MQVDDPAFLEATWRSGDAAACKAVYAGSIPAVASNRPPHSSAPIYKALFFSPFERKTVCDVP